MRFLFRSALRCAAVVTAIVFCAGGSADAAIIQVTINGTGTGTIGATPFTNSAFTITTQYDTATRVTVQPSPAIYGVPNVLAAINFPSIGSATFTEPTRMFVNQGSTVAGFSRNSSGDGAHGADILDVHSPAFATWNMLTAIGPVFDASPSPVSQAQGLSTTLGTLNFSAYSNATFTATVPEPTAAATIALTVVTATIAARRRDSLKTQTPTAKPSASA